jgi:hypothetical protein
LWESAEISQSTRLAVPVTAARAHPAAWDGAAREQAEMRKAASTVTQSA